MGGVHNARTSASSHMVLHKDQWDDNFSEQKALQTACGATVYASYNLVPCIQAALTEAMPLSVGKSGKFGELFLVPFPSNFSSP